MRLRVQGSGLEFEEARVMIDTTTAVFPKATI